MVEVRELVKSYGDFDAVRGVSFKVRRGEVLGFLGPNGAGKTTTMRIITGFMPATGGTVLVDGLDVLNDNMKVREKIGYLPENPPIYLEFTVRENLDFVAKLKKIPRSERAGRIEYAMERCGLTHVADRICEHLSKGYRQRVGLACAIVHEPEVLVLDEPTIGLDPVQIQEIRALIKDLGKQHTVILSTHILPEVVMTCDRVVIIHRGTVAADGTVDELSRQVGGKQRISVRLEEPNDQVIPRLKKLDGVEDVVPGPYPGRYQITVSEGAAAANEISLEILNAGWGLLEMTDDAPSLEEVFVQLTSM
ncbi:MAG: ABC transporter ATP-binding protein [Deltaproteobacteria bacterium]|nr:ABC transporter ATP-binding protein [bacterium]MCB9475967.1 ABC transporter ATP-binding protein [Deltaproteobacteria bacterium]MCB9487104.1 ABC transporter ATP-binding protein [Deltaproteobacteria bacterium]